MSAAAPRPLPATGFIGWRAANAALWRLVSAAEPAAAAKVFAPAGTPSAPPGSRLVNSVGSLLTESRFVFVDLPGSAWHQVLPMLRLAISDKTVLVLSGPERSVQDTLRHLNERKLMRCLVTPFRDPAEAIVACYASPFAGPDDKDRFRDLFTAGSAVLDLSTESELEVVQALTGLTPAALYTAVDALADGALLQGLPRAHALSCLATIVAASARALREGGRPGDLREAALAQEPAAAGVIELEAEGLRGTIMRAVAEAVRRAKPPHSPPNPEPE